MTKIWSGFVVLAIVSCAYALDFNPNPDVVIYDHERVHNFGSSIVLCDINNDTHLELVVGAHQGNNTVYVYYNNPFDRTPDLLIRPPAGYTPDAFSYRINCKGDLNGDGVKDLVVADSVNQNRGVFVYFGRTNFNGNSPDISIRACQSCYMGDSISVGDLNNNGVDDLIVSDYRGDTSVFYGGGSMDNISDIKFEDPGSSYGYYASAEGDLNDDSVKDLVVSSYSGNIYVYYGGTSFNNVSDLNISLGNGDGKVISGNDLNGDGLADLVVSGGSNTYLFFGGHDFNNLSDLTITGRSAYYEMLSSADLNNDGFKDLLIVSSGPTAHVYYGGTLLDNLSDANMSRSGVEYFGRAIASGDLNEDDVDDLVIGASTYLLFGHENSNKVYVYYGATSPLTNEAHETWRKLNTPQPTIVTLQGKLTNATSGATVNTASIKVTVSNSSGQVWYDTFNNVVVSGVFNIPLGAAKELSLLKGVVYSMKVEVDVGATTYSSADVTFGDGSPASDIIKFTA